MNLLSLQVFIMMILMLLPMSLLAQDKSSLCNEFQHHLNQRLGLHSYVVEEQEIQREDFNFIVPNIDVDGDKIKDEVLLFRTGSASIIAPDDSSVTLILSSTGKRFTVEMQRFYIIFYKLKYYIVASNWSSEQGPIFVDIKSMSRSGIQQLCSYKCGLKDGSCGPRQAYKDK